MYQIPYHRATFRPVNDLIPGNDTAETPVEFDVVPAGGPDLARIKSVLYASLGLVQDTAWTPDVQEAVIRAFETGAVAFVNTVEAVRGLTVPTALAIRAGLVQPPAEGKPALDMSAAFPVLNGLAFSKIAGFVPAMAMHVAMKVIELSGKTEVDPRFFVQPSGSGGTVTPSRTPGTVGRARKRSGKAGTAAGPTDQKANQQPGT